MISNSGFVFTKYSNNETDIVSCVTLFCTAYPSRFMKFVLSYKNFTTPFISLAKVKKEGTVEIFQTFLQQVSLYIFLAKKHLT